MQDIPLSTAIFSRAYQEPMTSKPLDKASSTLPFVPVPIDIGAS